MNHDDMYAASFGGISEWRVESEFWFDAMNVYSVVSFDYSRRILNNNTPLP